MFKAHVYVHEILKKIVEIFITLKEREVGQRVITNSSERWGKT